MKKPLKALAGIAVLIFASVSFSLRVAAVDSTSEAISGEGTAESPYIFLTGATSKVTWKHLNDVKSGKRSERYEIRENDSPEGKLRYSWYFSHDSITVPEGPYFLGINTYQGDAVDGLFGEDGCLYFSFAHKRDLPGKAGITLDVSKNFPDGAALRLYYYGGYDSTMVHGDSPVLQPDEIRTKDSLKEISGSVPVSGGFAAFEIRYGGNYVLANRELSEKPTQAPETAQAPEVSVSPAETSVSQSEAAAPAPETRPIGQLFGNEKLAAAVAASLGKSVLDPAAREDIDGIKKLYLRGTGLADLSGLAAFSFARLESLDLSDNSLTKQEALDMPLLESLNLSGNLLASAGELSAFPSVKALDFSRNKLTEVPDISTLPSLTTLNCSGNLLTTANPESGSLRYLDISNNNIIGGIDLTKCPGLEDFSIGEQHLSVSGTVKKDEAYSLSPVPELLEQYGESATVKIVTGREYEECIDEFDYAVLTHQNYRLDFSKYTSSPEYTVIVTGYYRGNEILGEYTYHLTVPDYKESSPFPLMAGVGGIAGAILLAGVLIGFRMFKNRR